MDSYLTPAGYGEAEYVDKKSRFIGQVSPVRDEAEAMAFVESVRKKYPDASHNVWAYSLRSGQMKYSDDGEPGGTSGQPTLNVFRSGEVYDVCCVVTRYFGGILLGGGGLVRAYSKAASLALDAAGLARMAKWTLVSVSCAYAHYERVTRLLTDLGAVDVQGQFAETVTVTALLPSESAAQFPSRLRDVTAGGATCEERGTTFRAKRME